MATLDPARLRELISYDPNTGVFTRRMKGRQKPIGWPNQEGYLRAELDCQRFLLHRLAFLYMTGSVPDGEVDHINGNPADNRWSNLRIADRAQNSKNRRKLASSQTKFKGVSKQPDCNRWRAEIFADGRKIYLGLFQTPEEAHAAYVDASQKYHGEFGRAE